MIAFDRHRHVIETMQTNIERATPAQGKELVRLLVERVASRDGRIESVIWTGSTVL